MHQKFLTTTLFGVLALLPATAPRGNLQCEFNGLHLCCESCENAVKQALARVQGISNVECDRENKTVTFTAQDDKSAKGAMNALAEKGFGVSSGTIGNVGFAQGGTTGAGKLMKDITVTGVHACCPQCNAAIKALFKNAEVTITGKGTQKDVRISGTEMTAGEVLAILQQGGFAGKVVEKK